MERYLQILKLLLNQKEPVTVNFIANKLKVSNKTVRNDLSKLEDYLNKENLCIIKKPGLGVYIQGDDLSKVNLVSEMNTFTDTYEAYSPEDRKHYILNRLFMADGYTTIKHLSEELYVSRVTLHKDLEYVESYLDGFNLKLIKKTNIGIIIDGPEEGWRNAIANLIASNKQSSELNKMLYQEYKGRIDYGTLNKLKEIADLDYKFLESLLTESEKKLKFKFSDEAFVSLIIHLAIAIKRLKQNKDIRFSEDIMNNLSKKEEYNIAQEIGNSIAEKFGIKVPRFEIGYILLHIIGAKMQNTKDYDQHSFDLTKDQENNLAAIIAKEIIERTNRAMSINLSDDKQLLNGLILHLIPTINRIKYGLDLKNPMLDEIKQNYPEIYGVAWMTSSVFEKYLGKKISEEEIGYIAIHIGAGIERQKKPFNVLVVCTSGIGTSQLLAVKLEKEYRNIEIQGIVSAGYINEHQLKDVDFIISTVNLADITKPFVIISPLFTPNDINKLDIFINNLKSIEKDKEFSKLLREEFIIVDSETKSKEQLIIEMCSKLHNLGYVNDGFLDDVLIREKDISTEVGNGVAIPHGNPDKVNKSVIFIVTLKEPILWKEDLVDLIFMICITKNQVGKANKLFRSFYEKIDSEDFLINVRNAENKEDIIQAWEEE